jgi:hypothetical protein
VADKDETQKLVEATRKRRKKAAQKGLAKSRPETISEPEQTTGEPSQEG